MPPPLIQGPEPSLVSASCDTPPASASYPPGTSCGVECAAGGLLWGALRVECTSGGTWTAPGGDPAPVCVSVPIVRTAPPVVDTCGDFANVHTGSVASAPGVDAALASLSSSAWASAPEGAAQVTDLVACASVTARSSTLSFRTPCNATCSVVAHIANVTAGPAARVNVSAATSVQGAVFKFSDVLIGGGDARLDCVSPSSPLVPAGTVLIAETPSVDSALARCVALATPDALRSQLLFAEWTGPALSCDAPPSATHRLVIANTSAPPCAFCVVGTSSSSPPPFESPSGAIIISDVLPAPLVTLSLPVPPSPGEALSVTCGPSVPTLAVPVMLTPSGPVDVVFGVPTVMQVRVPFRGRLRGSVAGNASAPPGADPASSVLVVCAFQSVPTGGHAPTYARAFTAVLAFEFRPSPWPLISNALVEYNVNASAWVWDPEADGSGRPRDADTAALVAAFPHAQLPSPPAGGYYAPILVSGATNVTLIGDSADWGAGNNSIIFRPDFRVAVGGVACAIVDRSPNGTAVTVTLPTYRDACGSEPPTNATAAPVECPPLQLTIAAQGVAVSCPPLCPGLPVWPVPTWDMAAGALSGAGAADRRLEPGGDETVVMLAGPSVPPGLLPVDYRVLNAGGVRGMGVQYVAACQGYADAHAQCLNASDPASRDCAWGLGDACQPCPSAALCPGGFDVLPRRGYYAPGGEAANPPVLAQCAFPAEDRCLGWSATLGAVECGAGYRQFAVGCGACADGYYPARSGACSACPADPTRDRAVLAGEVVVGIVLVATLVFVVTFFAVHAYHGDDRVLTAGTSQLLDFFIWLFLLVQTQAQVGRSVSAGYLPDAVGAYYGAMGFFLFQTAAVHPACTGGSDPVFAQARVEFGVALALAGVVLCFAIGACAVDGVTCVRARCAGRHRAVAAGARAERRGRHVDGTVANPLVAARRPAGADADTAARPPLPITEAARAFRRWDRERSCWRQHSHPMFLVTAALVLAYPAVTTLALQMVDCERALITVADYRRLAQDGTTLRNLGIPATAEPTVAVDASASRVVSVSVLASNTFVVCYETAHALVAQLASAVIAVYSLAAPVALYVLVRRAVRESLRRERVDVAAVDAATRARQRAYVNAGGPAATRPLRWVAVRVYGAGARFVVDASVATPGGRAAAAAAAAVAPAKQEAASRLTAADARDIAPGAVPGVALTLDDFADASERLRRLRPWRLFLASEFLPSRFAFRLVDLALLFGLCVVTVVMSDPTTLATAAAKLCATVALTAGVGACYLVSPPYTHVRTRNAWKYRSKLLQLALLLALALLNFVASADGIARNLAASAADRDALAGRADALGRASVALAYACLVVSVLLFLTISTGFASSLFSETRHDARLEEDARQRQRDEAELHARLVAEARAVGRPRSRTPRAVWGGDPQSMPPAGAAAAEPRLSSSASAATRPAVDGVVPAALSQRSLTSSAR